jgi:hypothetical protein
MTKSMTSRQINKLVQIFRAASTSGAANVDSVHAASTLEGAGLGGEMYAAFLRHVELQSRILIRDYTVDQSVTGMAAISATGRTFWGHQKVAEDMPRALSSSGKIHFFQTGSYTPASELAREAKKRGLVLADPHSLAAYNKANPYFAKDHPNATQWQDDQDKVCSATFSGWYAERDVEVCRRDSIWKDDRWFAGFRISELSPET